MADAITVALPDDLSAKVRATAISTSQSVEDVLLNYLRDFSAPLPALPPDEQAELNALQKLSDDALWTIAQEHMPDTAETRAQTLMSSKVDLSDEEQRELQALVDRADRLMLRKAEAATILRQRGHNFTQQDFKPRNA